MAKGWAVNPASQGGQGMKLVLGRYTVTETIMPTYVRLLNISSADASASVKIKVVKASGCCGLAARAAGPAHRPQNRPLRSAPAVPTVANPPASTLPDLAPLPSWGISVDHIKKTKTHPASDQLDFGATVWVGERPPGCRGLPVPRLTDHEGLSVFLAKRADHRPASRRDHGIRLEEGP